MVGQKKRGPSVGNRQISKAAAAMSDGRVTAQKGISERPADQRSAETLGTLTHYVGGDRIKLFYPFELSEQY